MVIDGRKLAGSIIRALKSRPRPHGALVAVLVGSDPASLGFVRQKAKAAKSLKIPFSVRHFPSTISQEKLASLVSALGRNKKIGGIIVQLPLPQHIKNQEILERIPPEKDVDVLSSAAFGRFVAAKHALTPPVVGALKLLSEKYRIKLKGKYAAVVGAGKLVGIPAAVWLAKEGATVSVLNEWTRGLARFTRDADILVTAAGKPGLVTGRMVKAGVFVFDAGYAIKKGKPAGDCDFRSVSKKAKIITPVPGGIGPLTVAMLFKNFYDLARR